MCKLSTVVANEDDVEAVVKSLLESFNQRGNQTVKILQHPIYLEIHNTRLASYYVAVLSVIRNAIYSQRLRRGLSSRPWQHRRRPTVCKQARQISGGFTSCDIDL